MKRGGPLKRKTELARGGPIKAKPWPDQPRTPLRRTPIARAAPLERTGDGPQRPLKARKAIAPVSAARQAMKTARAALVARLVADGVACEICPELARHGIVVPGGCRGRPGGLHERRKRSSWGSVEHAPNLIPCCNSANGWVEDQAGSARERFGTWLVLREGDPEWKACARDVDPAPVVSRLCERCGAAYLTVAPSGLLACGHRSG